MISQIQAHLEAIYSLDREADAEAYVVDTEAARALGGRGEREELLVHQDGEALELALYLDPQVIARLARFEGPASAWIDGELDGYCQVAEGVSHFVYLARAANEGRTVSLLELEAQAEVDKFAICLLHRWGEGARAWAKELFERLFHRISLRPGLSADEQWRYGEANRLSRNYCQRLFPHVETHRLDKLLETLRYTYRLGAEAKLVHLARAF